ncbi:hypothetical protein V6N13_065161 [Hibiscus sabdariffa]
MATEDGVAGIHGSQTTVIQGHVENETLWKLTKCLVGTMTTVSSARTVADRLHQWGLGETKVKSMGGKKFLLQIEDDELLKLLEEQKWSLPNEVFLEVEYWNELFRVSERIIWVEIRGIQLHCWNGETFKRIAGIWGNIVALGENANQVIDCESITILISTTQPPRIAKIVMLEVGNVKYPIWVSEVASPPAQFKETRTRIIKQNSGKVESSSSSSTASSNQCSKLKSQLEDSGEALETVNEQQSGGNFEALGKSKEGSKDISEEANIKDNGDKIYNGEEEICLQKSISLSQVRGKSKKNKELIDNSGPGPEPKGGGSNEPSNHKRDLNPRGVDEVSFSDGEGATRRSGKSKDTNSERAVSRVGSDFELPEFHNMFKASRIRKKRFGSLFDIQDKGLSDVDRRKRDRVRKRLKKKGKLEETTELEGYSVTDSDIRARRNLLLAEATKTLEVGKLVGIEFIGNENEVVQDLILIAEKE